MIPFGDLGRHYRQIKADVDAALSQVLDSGWFILGKKVEAFEAAFAAYCGAEFGIGVGSGVEALHLALVGYGIGPGDEVITVANTCVPTLTAISFAGASPVLVDVDAETYTMDPDKIEARLTEKTRAILPVHLYGQCADMEAIVALAKKHNLVVIEDCAQAHGAMFQDRKAGTWGDAGCFSFYPSKNLGAFGDGGLIVTNNAKMAARLKQLRNYGQERRDHHTIKGFNSRLDEVQAAILLAKLPYLDAWNQRRREIAQVYTEAFSYMDVICPVEGPNCHHIYHLYVIRVKDRARFQEQMLEQGVQTVVHYPVPIHRQVAYSETLDQAPYLETTDALASEIVSLPNYPELTDEEVGKVIDAVKAAT